MADLKTIKKHEAPASFIQRTFVIVERTDASMVDYYTALRLQASAGPVDIYRHHFDKLDEAERDFAERVKEGF